MDHTMRDHVQAGLSACLAPLRHRWALPAIIALAILLRLAVMLIWPQAPFSDGTFYMKRGAELAAGLGYQEGGFATAFWPVGQAFLVALGIKLAGPGLAGILAINLLAAGLTVWLIAWFGKHVGGSALAGQVGALLYALYPAHIAYSGTPLSEVSSTALGMAALALLVGGRHRFLWIAVAGFMFGAATLVRAQLFYFPFGVLIAMALLLKDFGWRRALGGGLLLYCAALCVILPWTMRNKDVLGEPVFVSTNGGVALYTGAFDGATGDHVAWDKAMYERSGVPFEERIARQIEMDRNLKAQATAWIKAHPGRYLGLMPKKALILWSKDSDGFWGLKGSYPEMEGPLTILQWVNQIFYMLVILLALPALWAGLRSWLGRREDEDKRLLIMFLMPAFVTLTAIVFTGQIRYHFPAMPFLMVAVGWSIAHFASRGQGTRFAKAAQLG